MRSIGEVAAMLQVHSQTIRNWERKGLIAPNRIGHNRIFSTYDIQRMQQIKKYSGRGIHIRGILELLKLSSQNQATGGGEQ